jgi:CRP/FNR family cyclic AMP-dependent transcriptional regulator
MNLFGTSANRKSVEMLRQLDVFRDLSFREALELDELLHERVFEKGEIVFEEGDIGHGIFVVVSGKVRVEAGQKLLKEAMVEFGPGEMLGELTLFEEAPRIATVVAVERTVMVALLRAEFSSLLTKNTKLGVKVLVRLSTTMCRRVRRLLLGERHQPSL